MDLHRLGEERSVAYHRAVAEHLADDPRLLETARARVNAWCAGAVVPHYAQAWSTILARPLPEILVFLVDPGERARELRQSTPFAGILPPRERWRIWRETRERLGAT